MTDRLLKSREVLGCRPHRPRAADRDPLPRLRRAREPRQRVQRHLDPDHAGAGPDGGDPDQVHRPLGRRQPGADRHGRRHAERGLSRRADPGADAARGGGRRRPRRLQRPPGLEARHPADRRHPRHAHHLPRHHLPDLRRRVDQRPRDEPRLQGRAPHRAARPAGPELDRRRGRSCSSGSSSPAPPSAAPSTPSAATRAPPSTPASTSAAPASPPSSSPARWPASAATSGFRATRSPMSTSPAASSSTWSPPA